MGYDNHHSEYSLCSQQSCSFMNWNDFDPENVLMKFCILPPGSRTLESPESVSDCFDDGWCQLWAPCSGIVQIAVSEYLPLETRMPGSSRVTADRCSRETQHSGSDLPSRKTWAAGSSWRVLGL